MAQMNKMILRGMVCVVIASGLVACGQRGALYLPEESRNVVVTPAPAAAAPSSASPATATATDSAAPATDPAEEQRRRNAPASTPAN